MELWLKRTFSFGLATISLVIFLWLCFASARGAAGDTPARLAVVESKILTVDERLAEIIAQGKRTDDKVDQLAERMNEAAGAMRLMFALLALAGACAGLVTWKRGPVMQPECEHCRKANG